MKLFIPIKPADVGLPKEASTKEVALEFWAMLTARDPDTIELLISRAELEEE